MRKPLFLSLLRQIAIHSVAWQDSRMGPSAGILLVAALALGVSGGAGAAAHQSKAPVKSSWGQTGGASVEIYTLTNVHGLEARIMTYGATLVSLKAPDRAGHFKNIVLGFDAIEPYLGAKAYYGATVGRYANRIAKARFTLDGKTYQLAANDGPNTLHGGIRGFDKRIWKAEPLPASEGNGVRLTYVSAAGEEGFPGELTVQAVYRLDDNDNLEIEYGATTTAPTPVNLANHAYFNLTGEPDVPVLDHVLTINADRHPLMSRMHKPDLRLGPDEQDKRSVVPIELVDVDQWLHGTVTEAAKLIKLAPVEAFDAAPMLA